MEKPIFLIGPRASGKTTVGRALAVRLNLDFVDMDQHLTATHQATVAQIVAREGWAGFRQRESAALRQVTRPGLVVATGGGLVLAPENRLFLRERGQVFYLAAPAEVLAARLAADPQAAQRPSLTGRSLLEELGPVLEEREPLYQEAAHYRIEAAIPLDTVLGNILAHLRPKSPAAPEACLGR